MSYVSVISLGSEIIFSRGSMCSYKEMKLFFVDDPMTLLHFIDWVSTN